MPAEIDPYDYDLAIRCLREIAANRREPEARAIARTALAIIEPGRAVGETTTTTTTTTEAAR